MNSMVEGPLQFERSSSGWHARDGGVHFFFGGATMDWIQAKNEFPGLKLSYLNQIHSDRIVMVDDYPFEMAEIWDPVKLPVADAQWTKLKGVAMCVRTADCLPILVRAGHTIAAIHAGWRGLEANIIGNSIEAIAAAGGDMAKIKAVIGPHIGCKSFEVGRDVAERLAHVFRSLRFNPAPISYQHPDDSKRFVDLAVLAQAQLIQSGVDERAVGIIRADTLLDSSLHSFRRDGEKAGRQISLIYMSPN